MKKLKVWMTAILLTLLASGSSFAQEQPRLEPVECEPQVTQFIPDHVCPEGANNFFATSRTGAEHIAKKLEQARQDSIWRKNAEQRLELMSEEITFLEQERDGWKRIALARKSLVAQYDSTLQASKELHPGFFDKLTSGLEIYGPIMLGLGTVILTQ